MRAKPGVKFGVKPGVKPGALVFLVNLLVCCAASNVRSPETAAAAPIAPAPAPAASSAPSPASSASTQRPALPRHTVPWKVAGAHEQSPVEVVRAPYVDVVAFAPASPEHPDGTVVAVTTHDEGAAFGSRAALVLLEGDVRTGAWIRRRGLPLDVSPSGAAIAADAGHVFVAVALFGEDDEKSLLFELDANLDIVTSRRLEVDTRGHGWSTLSLALHPRFVVVSEREGGPKLDEGGALVSVFERGTLAPVANTRVGAVGALPMGARRHLVVVGDEVFTVGDHFPLRKTPSSSPDKPIVTEELALTRLRLPSLDRVAAVDVGAVDGQQPSLAIVGGALEIVSAEQRDRFAFSLDASSHRRSPDRPARVLFPKAGRIQTDCPPLAMQGDRPLSCTPIWSRDVPAVACLARVDDNIARVVLHRLDRRERVACID